MTSVDDPTGDGVAARSAALNDVLTKAITIDRTSGGNVASMFLVFARGHGKTVRAIARRDL